MKTEIVGGEIEAYQGKSDWPGVTFPIKYAGEVEIFENVAELRAAGAFPSDADVLDMVNSKRKATAKAGAYQKAIGDNKLKEMHEKSPDFLVAGIVKNAMQLGWSKEDAEAFARQKIGG